MSTRNSAECTGLRESTTPSAPGERAGRRTGRRGRRSPEVDLRIVRASSSGSARGQRSSAASPTGPRSGSRTPKPSSPDHATLPSNAAWPDGAVARIHALVSSSSPPSHSSHGWRRARPSSSTSELTLRVDRVLAVRERELEQLRLGDRLGRARLDAQVAVDAAQVVDLVDEAVALARRHRGVGRVVGAAHVDALRRAHARAQLAPDALLHPVLVAVEDVATVEALRLRPLVLRVVAGELLPEDLRGS